MPQSECVRLRKQLMTGVDNDGQRKSSSLLVGWQRGAVTLESMCKTLRIEPELLCYLDIPFPDSVSSFCLIFLVIKAPLKPSTPVYHPTLTHLGG